MFRHEQPGQGDGLYTRTFYRSKSLFPWLYVHDGRTWHVYASDGTWVQDKGSLSKETRAELIEVTRAKGEALLATGRAKTIEVESAPRLHFLPPWKAPMLYLRVIVTVAGIAAAVILRGTVGYGLYDNPKSAWGWAAYGVVFLLWALFFIGAGWFRNRQRRHYSFWERKDP